MDWSRISLRRMSGSSGWWSVGKDTNGNEFGEGMVFGWNTVLRRSGVCAGKDTGIKQRGRGIVGLLLVKKISSDTGRKRGRIRPKWQAKAKVWQRQEVFHKALGVWERNTPIAQTSFMLCVFRPAGSYCSRKRQLVRKRMPMHPLTNNMAEFILPKTRRECLSEEIHLFKWQN